MQNGKKKTVDLLVGAACALTGILVIWYGFELLTVPHLREYNEWMYLLIGLVFVVGGIGYLAYKGGLLKRR